MRKKYRRLERRKMKRSLRIERATFSIKRKNYESKGEYLTRLDFYEHLEDAQKEI